MVEEHSRHQSSLPERPAELLLFQARDRETLLRDLEQLQGFLRTRTPLRMIELAVALRQRIDARGDGVRLAIVAESASSLEQRLTSAIASIREQSSLPSRGMLAFSESTADDPGPVAFLFPGQGSQKLEMLEALAMVFPAVRETFEQADASLRKILPKALTGFVFPPPGFDPDERKALRQELDQTWIAQPALGAADAAMFHLLGRLGLRPDFVAGHSYGEYVALYAAGVFSFEDLMLVSEQRGRVVQQSQGRGEVAMLAVSESSARLEPLLVEGTHIAGYNAPGQVLIGGAAAEVDRLAERLSAEKIAHRKLAMSAGFHIPEASAAAEAFAPILERLEMRSPKLAVVSNLTGEPYPDSPAGIRETLIRQLTRPVVFQKQIEWMHAAGARTFVEVGPGSVLTNLAQQSLPDDVVVLRSNGGTGKTDVEDLLALAGTLFVAGRNLNWSALYEGCDIPVRDLDSVLELAPAPASTAVLVDGGRVMPLGPASLRALSRPPSAVQDAPPVDTTLSPRPPESSHPGSERSPSRSAQTPFAAMQETMRRFLELQERSQRRRQEMMSRFLETQRRMVETLSGGPFTPSVDDQPRTRETGPASDVPSPVEVRVHPGTEPVLPPEPAVSEPAASGSGSSDRSLRDMVLEMVSERTGYPVEMLDLDYTMEGDLGIDSIKRTEIFGALRARVALETIDQEEYFLAIARLRTLREVLEWLESQREAGSEAARSDQATSAVVRTEPANILRESARASGSRMAEAVRRYRVVPVESPLNGSRATVPDPSRVILLSDDGEGRGRQVLSALRSLGHPVALVRHGSSFRVLGAGEYEANLVLTEDVRALKKVILEKQGPVGSLIHLLPLGRAKSSDAPEVRGLFVLATVFGEQIRGARGAVFGLRDSDARVSDGVGESRPAALAVGGFLKSLAKEWPEVRVRSLSVDSAEPHDLLAARLLSELMATDRTVEVAYGSEGRFTFGYEPADLDLSRPGGPVLDSDAVVLVTGGARGITAMLAEAVAARYRCRLVLVGRSPAPVAEESDTATTTRASDLKVALIERRRKSGEPITPAIIDADFDRLIRGREIRRNLESLRAWSPSVEYRPLDARNPQALRELIEQIYRTSGRLDGIIHGAGVVEDHYLLSKSLESFDRVVDTKLVSAATLIDAVHPESLRFLVLMSSIAARFGYAGGTDYAAANDALNHLARHLDRSWPGRVVSIGWGPWDEVGIASRLPSDVETQRGLLRMPVRSGCEQFVRELELGQKGDPEILLFAGTPDESFGAAVSPVSSIDDEVA